MPRTDITSTDFKSLFDGKIISKYNITDICVIDDECPNHILIRDCSFNELRITCRDKKNIRIDNCSFSDFLIEGNLENLNICNLNNCKSIQIEEGGIDFIRFANSDIEEVQIFSQYNNDSNNINIDRLLFLENRINKIILSGNINDCSFWGNKRLGIINCQAKIKKFIITKNRFGEEQTEDCIVDELFISEEINTEYTLFNADLRKFVFVAKQNKSNLTIKKCEFHKIRFVDTFSNSNIYISTSTILDSFIFDKCEVSQLTISNLDLSRTRFILLDSFLNNFRWHHVKWSSDIEFYKNDEEEDIAYDPIDTLRLLKQKAIQLEDVFCKIIFQKLEFSSIIDRIRGAKWNNNKSFKLKWFINPLRDFYLIFHSKDDFSSVDKMIFYLNRYSNNFGLNPLRGVVFTLGVGLIFFVLYVLNLSDNNFQWGWNGFSDFGYVLEEYLPHFCKFLYAGHKFDFMIDFSPNSYARIFDLLGRIFIGYGYYQIVRSFRKYSK
ncbi:hypothetical protein [Marinifilum flexuosum]|uniref:hypothetical protein n=1 Tax=Marinifilum flexuosum TaxID=1117708 RepID=UPI002494EF67|nr:hypothetical protein [Marinifilum flexuosum]